MGAENEDHKGKALTVGGVVGIGASAGGLDALKALFSALPNNTGMAYVIIQHAKPDHATSLASILGSVASMPVAQAEDGAELLANRIYTAPADRDLIIEEKTLRLIPRELSHRLHLPVDTFFCSLAQELGANAIGIVLSGAGSDGTVGLGDIKTAGGITFAQDEKSAQHTAMPKSAITAGHVDYILSPSDIASELSRIASFGESSTEEGEELDAIREVIALLRASVGVDFTHYKQTTISRRVHRRLGVSKAKSARDYVEILKNRPDELQELYREFLINVTSFFRDPDMFDALEALIFSRITESRSSDDPIRIWVPGCATGEEVYSLLICLMEYGARRGKVFPIQVFGTDISEPALEKARAGIYPSSISSMISAVRLRDFFEVVEGGYQVKKSLRELCVFARQNVIADPPLSRMDLISCRNLLIYFGPALQERIVPIFHYALKVANGFLVLGKSELIDLASEFFLPVDKAHKFYVKKDAPLRVSFQPVSGQKPTHPPDARKLTPSTQSARDTEFDIQKEADRLILQNFSPASVVVTQNMDIIQFRGRTAPYLDPSGRASLSFFKMLHSDLLHPVRKAIEQAKAKDTRTVRCNHLRFRADDEFKFVNVRIIPLKSATLKQRHFLVVFEEPRPPKGEARIAKSESTSVEEAEVTRFSEVDEIQRLTEELEENRRHLQTVIDEREVTVEELQSSNEEVTSSNEELQTINQELETAKEELESSNEELTTLNEQLRQSMDKLKKSEERFRVLVAGVKDYAILMLDQNGYIISWNQGAERIKGYSAQEIIGKHFSVFYKDEDRRSGKPDKELETAKAVGRYEEEGVRVRKDGSEFSASVIITPLIGDDGKLYGFAKVTRDITERVLAEERFIESEERFRHFVQGVTDYAIFMLDPKGHILSWNAGAERINGYKAEEIIGQHFSKFYTKQAREIHHPENELKQATSSGHYEEEGWRVRKDGSVFWASVLITAIRDKKGSLLGFSKVTRDLTERRRREEDLRKTAKFIKLLQVVAVAANKSSDFRQIIQFCLDEVCTHMGWPVGHAYLLADDSNGTLISSGIWHFDDPKCCEEFRKITAETTFAKGVGLPGKILATAKSAWIQDVHKDIHFARTQAAKDIEIKAAFGFPILADKRVVGVMEFFSDSVDPDDSFLGVMDHIGAQLGHVYRRQEAEQALKLSEERNRLVLDAAFDAFVVIDEEGLITGWNPQAEVIFGWSHQEVMGRSVHDTIIPPQYREAHSKGFARFLKTGEGPMLNRRIELTARYKDGREFPVELTISPIRLGSRYIFSAFIHDISERKRAEEALRQSEKEKRSLAKFPSERPAPVMRISPDGRIIYANAASKPLLDIWDSGSHVSDEIKQLVGELCTSGVTKEIEVVTGDKRIYSLSIVPITDENYLNIYGTEITERKRAEEALKKYKDELEIRIQERTRELQKSNETLAASIARLQEQARLLDLSADSIIVRDEEGKIHYWNKGAEKMYGWSSEKAIGNVTHNLLQTTFPKPLPEIEQELNRDGQWKGELEHKRNNGSSLIVASRWVIDRAATSPKRIMEINSDITDRKRAEAMQTTLNETLARSNQELEQFAFIASHDLQEPLRMVTTYLQYIDRRTKAKLDESEKEFIGFAVDGAIRMKTLIEDLLAYARIGKAEEKTGRVAFNAVVEEATANLKTAIDETKAQITTTDLPILNANHRHVVQLFQNLIGNALKYRSEKRPEVHITAEEKDGEWLFSVRDNGIGISPEYGEKIFVVFQRLHSDRAKYPGTGIGLAICKKIVEHHRGRIWVESQPDVGSTFYFTIPRLGGARI